MEFEESVEQQALRTEARGYLEAMVTPEVRSRLIREGEESPLFVKLMKQMGTDGWLGLGWPTEYGGQGYGPMEQFIFFDEVRRIGAPINFVTINTVGPTLIAHGTEEQKRRFLPSILRGETQISIGYSESDAGTDLASLKTLAVREGDEYIVNGQKVYTSRAQIADYIWLACRTDPKAAKHKGISILLVPTDQPGFSWSPIRTVGGPITTATYYDNVGVPAENLVGAENEGWRLLTGQLNHERVGLAAFGATTQRIFEEVTQWCTTTVAGGRPLIHSSWIRAELARTYAQLAALRLLNWRMAFRMSTGELAASDSSAAKVCGSEIAVQVYRSLLGIVGSVGYLPLDSPGAVLRGDLEYYAREAQINTFGGGTNEIQREIVAWSGLKMKRSTGASR